MTLWSVYHTLFGVFATFTVSYITPMMWYPHFIFYSEKYKIQLPQKQPRTITSDLVKLNLDDADMICHLMKVSSYRTTHRLHSFQSPFMQRKMWTPSSICVFLDEKHR